MQIRASRISASIADAITQEHQSANRGDSRGQPQQKLSSASKRLANSLLAFFSLFRLSLTRHRPATFLELRHDAWKLDEDEYLSSFPSPAKHPPHGNGGSNSGGDDDQLLIPIGDLGYSGSTFFSTPNSKFLIKSLPRRAEYDFFTRDLLASYAAHALAHPASLLVRIVDLVRAAQPALQLGGLLGFAPTHHIVMENLLYGRPDGSDNDDDDDGDDDGWATFDLKPEDYFFPERDIADGRLAPDSVKDRLVDTMPHQVVVAPHLRDALVAQLKADTALLAAHSAVDYSLFLVRYPQQQQQQQQQPSGDQHPPTLASDVPCPWREGVPDARGRWTYRAVVLDFFWAKSRLPAKAMTGLIGTFNLVARRGPMSITAEPNEYRQRFLKMVNAIVKVPEDDATEELSE
jgi:hypothetical protein